MSTRDRIMELLDKLAKEEEAGEITPSAPAVKPMKTSNRKKILKYVDSFGYVTVPQMMQFLGHHSRGSAYTSMRKMVELGLLVPIPGTSPRQFRRPRQDDEPIDTTTTSERILQYISDHMGEFYSIADMAREFGIPHNTVYSQLHRLKKKGLVPEGFNEGRQFTGNFQAKAVEVAKEIVDIPEVEPDVVETDKEEATNEGNGSAMYDIIDGLVWRFIKDTNGQTNVLEFLKYVNEKVGK